MRIDNICERLDRKNYQFTKEFLSVAAVLWDILAVVSCTSIPFLTLTHREGGGYASGADTTGSSCLPPLSVKAECLARLQWFQRFVIMSDLELNPGLPGHNQTQLIEPCLRCSYWPDSNRILMTSSHCRYELLYRSCLPIMGSLSFPFLDNAAGNANIFVAIKSGSTVILIARVLVQRHFYV